MNRDDRIPPEAPRRLELDDEGETPAETTEEMRRLQAQFWAKLPRPCYGQRCIDYTQPPLTWD